MTSNRLSKILAWTGIASRRACEELIFSGKVEVDGEVVTLPQTMVDPSKSEIRVEGRVISCEEKKYTFLLNKPRGYICSNKRIGTKKLVIDLFKGVKARLFTVGRLDRDTTGLLIVTNDGYFAQQVIHPSSNISKEYLVKTMEEVSADHLKKISKGTLIEEKWIRPCSVTKVRKGTVKIVVKEGKKREVRYLMQNAGLLVLSLTRIRIGGLRLGALEKGKWREITEREKTSIFQ
jgi:23S rRNA pseudouridine2605 synthase